MTEPQTEEKHSEQQARAQLDSIVLMVGRLDHCQDCDGEDCELTDKNIIEGLGCFYDEGQAATEEEREEYHDEEKARQAINEDPLTVQVRSGWAASAEEFEAEEFEILLCTGGPACRIVGDLDRGQPDRARIEHQDWGTPWTEYLEISSDEREALLTYAKQFYFGS